MNSDIIGIMLESEFLLDFGDMEKIVQLLQIFVLLIFEKTKTESESVTS